MSDLTIDKLGSAVQDFLSSQYPPVAGATAIFAAQPCGLPVDTSTFGSNLLLPAQEINDLADITARVISSQFWPTLIKASGLYEILLSAMPIDSMAGDQLVEFGKLRGGADEAYHNQLANITTTPSNWWDASASGNWTTHTISSDQVTGTPPPILPWRWHVLPPKQLPVLSLGLHRNFLPVDQAVNPIEVRSSPPLTETATIASTNAAHQMISAPLSHSLQSTQMSVQSPATLTAAQASIGTIKGIQGDVSSTLAGAQGSIGTISQATAPLTLVASFKAVTQIASVASIQTVQAEHINISFDYCLVNLARSWWNGLFVATKGWYIPTYGAGDLSAGSGDGSGGQCPTIPTAFFLVRNVTISGSWSEQDRLAIPGAASFGPISLIGRSIDSNLTISIPGMQIIGWMANLLPPLPPTSDPNLSTLQISGGNIASFPTLSSGQQGAAVARLQGLLRAATPGSTDAALTIDGNFGATTVAAVQDLQQHNGLNASGIADGITWQKLLGLS